MTRWLARMALVLLASVALADEGLESRFDKDVLIVEATEHACHRFDIYLAISATQRSRGLMFVREMAPTTGMLFVYTNEPVSMWMKNTYISLDMLFIRADGTVSSIARNTEPQSLKSIYSIEPVAFVLELNAGVTERLSIDENSRIFWEPAHGNDE